MASVTARTEVAFEHTLSAETVSPQRLYAAMRHATLGAGKHVRPLLVYAAGALGGASPEALDGVSYVVEITHVCLFVHDDMPYMDDDDPRRGRPAVHRVYGKTTALLVGDALQMQAFTVLAEQGAVRPAMRVVLMGELTRALGPQDMAGNRATDPQSVDTAPPRDELKVIHCMKAGAFLRASLRMGVFCAEANAVALEYVDVCVGAVGLVLQVVDDILDVTADTVTPSKIAGRDKANSKPVYVSILRLDKVRAPADKLHAAAGAAVAKLAREIGCEAGRTYTIRSAEMIDLIMRHGHRTVLHRRQKLLPRRLSGDPT